MHAPFDIFSITRYHYHAQTPLCAANSVVTSTTGGFAILRYYNTPTCSNLPTATTFYQLNVCGQQANNGSTMIVPQALATQTLFVQKQWESNDCSGSPLTSQTGGFYNAKINNIGNTSTICAPSNQGDPNVAFVTIMKVITTIIMMMSMTMIMAIKRQ